jgi:excisionase family DNA binding protein
MHCPALSSHVMLMLVVVRLDTLRTCKYNPHKRQRGVRNMTQASKLTIKDVARELDVDERSVRRWLKKGELKHVGFDIRGRYLIARDDLDAFVKQRTEGRQG